MLSFPLELLSEEGARFPISMVASGVWAGEIPLERAHNLKEVGGGDGRTMKEELERIGYLGTMEASYKAMPLGVRYAPYELLEVCVRLMFHRLTSNCISVSHFLDTALWSTENLCVS